MDQTCFDWNTRASLNGEHILVHRSTPGPEPLITIGLPTYKRPDTLKRALASLQNQTYQRFKLIISDNSGVNEETIDILNKLDYFGAEILLVCQPKNLGALGNLHYLLSCCETEYFCWLADDDEFSNTYIEDLLNLLQTNERAVSAMGRWKKMDDPTTGAYITQHKIDSSNRALRTLKFILGPSDDSFFYGVHRTNELRKCTFSSFAPPNTQVITNFCYVFMFDLILSGPILYADTCTWSCHNYSEKSYEKAKSGGLLSKMKTLLRRFNVHYCYLRKLAINAPGLVVFGVIASITSIILEILFFNSQRFNFFSRKSSINLPQ